MGNTLVQVKTYLFDSAGIRLYFIGDNPDAPELTYNDGQMEHKFSGTEIIREQTQCGELVSVMLEVIPDLSTTTLSLALPAANRDENIRSIAVQSFAVRTTNRTSIAGPDILEGLLQSYEVMSLDGLAW